MAFVHRTSLETAADLRRLTGVPALDEVTVYDADFPAEAGQQFVTAVLSESGTVRAEVDLTDPTHAELSELLHEQAAEFDETVKFCLDLPAS